MIAPLSDQTLAEQLFRRLRGGRVFQVFMRRLGPGDVVYVSALAFDADEIIVEVKASALDPETALVNLLKGIDQATAPEDL